MRKKRKLWAKPALLFPLSAVLLLMSTVGSTRAALTYYSDNYGVQVEVAGIGVTLLENGDRPVTDGALLTGMTGEGENLVLGKEYEEELSVRNSGEIDTYVRVILWKSWKDAQGKKDTALSPELIDLRLNLSAGGWVIDPAASTKERTVLYYKKPLAGDPQGDGSGGITPALCSAIRIDPSLRSSVKKTVLRTDKDGNQTVRTEYEYDGYSFEVKAEVDAVQARSAADAVRSAWGVEVQIAADGMLSLASGESTVPPENP